MSELTEHLRHIGCLNKPRCIEAADLLDAQATELARLRKQFVAQQARIVELRDALEQSALDSATHGVTCGAVTILRAKALATTDDLSALAEHDKQVWNEALNTVKHRTSDLRLSERQLEIVKGLKR